MEAPSVHRVTEDLFANFISLNTKRLSKNNCQESVNYTSVASLCRRHLRNIVRYLRRLCDSVCLSPHISEEPLVFTFSPNRLGDNAVNKKGRQRDLLADWAFNLFRRYD